MLSRLEKLDAVAAELRDAILLLDRLNLRTASDHAARALVDVEQRRDLAQAREAR